MFHSDQYELLDFGAGRRLERFGPLVLDRPCPTADSIPQARPEIWSTADARFERGEAEQGRWRLRRALADRWTVRHGKWQFELKLTDFGHVGLFPEQAANWDWLTEQLRGSAAEMPAMGGTGPERLRVLNLFAYTGGSTLAAAAAGAEVTHVDAAKNVVAWARRNAELSGRGEVAIRWIAEDALKFAKRELRRGSRYDAAILDPPSYGHGPRGEVWRLSKHLPRLLQLCAELTAGRQHFMLLTCHTPGYEADRLRRMVAETFQHDLERIAAETMSLRTADNRALPSGIVVRWGTVPIFGQWQRARHDRDKNRDCPLSPREH